MFRAGLQEESSGKFIRDRTGQQWRIIVGRPVGGSNDCNMDEDPNRAVAVGMERERGQRMR